MVILRAHGLADMIADNGPKYTSAQLTQFSREWKFQSYHQSYLWDSTWTRSSSRCVRQPQKEEASRQSNLWQARQTITLAYNQETSQTSANQS